MASEFGGDISGPWNITKLSEGLSLQNFRCCQDLIFGIREESEKSPKVNLHHVDVC